MSKSPFKNGVIALLTVTNFVLLYLWVAELGAGVGWNYMEESYSRLEAHSTGLEAFLANRDPDMSDLMAFTTLGLINANQFDGKYDPWIDTQLGFILFDGGGKVAKICGPASALNSVDCPENL